MYLQNECFGLLDFWHKKRHQRKVKSETKNSSLLWPSIPSYTQLRPVAFVETCQKCLWAALWIREKVWQQNKQKNPAVYRIYDSIWQQKKYSVVYMIYGNGLENNLIHGKTAKLKLQLFIFPFHIIIANLESFLNQQKDVKNCYVK